MKKHRKQSVNVLGQKLLVDVPVDDELYKADNREEYLRSISKSKHIPLDDDSVFAGYSTDVAEGYEEAQLLECLRESLRMLNEKERQLVQYIFFDGLTEKETSVKLGKSQQAVSKQKRKIIEKLRNSLIDWA